MLTTVVGPFFTALLIAGMSIPVIIRVADLKHLMDVPDQSRKLHNEKIPTLGGVAIFAGVLFSFSVFTDYLGLSDIRFMIPALVLLFFAGIKDDILILSPFKKLGIQIVCATLITLVGDLRLTSLWGIFGVTEIVWPLGVGLTLVTIVALINAFNLIDGINGLAASLGIVAALFFGVWFYMTEALFLCILSFSLIGALCGFLRYNLSPARIFMGDTGSMIIGFIVSLLAIKFVENNRSGLINSDYYIKAAPGVAIAILLVPIADLARVFVCRLIKKKNPFAADRTHIHHILVDLGLSHTWSTALLIGITFVAVVVAWFFKERSSFVVVILISGIYMLSLFICFLLKRQMVRIERKKFLRREVLSNKL